MSSYLERLPDWSLGESYNVIIEIDPETGIDLTGSTINLLIDDGSEEGIDIEATATVGVDGKATYDLVAIPTEMPNTAKKDYPYWLWLSYGEDRKKLESGRLTCLDARHPE